MKRLIKSLKDLYKKYLISFKRFPVSNCIVLLLGLFLIMSIICEFGKNFFISLSLSLFLSLFISLYISLIIDNNIINSIISSISTIVLYLLVHDNYNNYYIELAYAGLLIICILLIIDIISKNIKGNIHAYLIDKLVYCLVISLIILIGLIICSSCFYFLIYSFIDLENLYLIVIVICLVILFFSLFLIYIPKKGDTLKISNLYSLLLNKVSLTLYYLLIILLYIYLIKIAITFTLPVGVINWFASFSLLFYIFFTLSNDDNYFLNLFNKKFGSYILIPIFIIQHISIFIRINAYGLTTSRVLSLVFNLISLIFIILYIIKKMKYFYTISCAIIFIFTVIPFTNAIDIPAIEQQYRLKSVLLKNNMLDNNVIIPNENISFDDKQIIISSYDYLRDSYSNKINLAIKDIDFGKTFGFDYFDITNINSHIYCNYYSNIKKFDVSNYHYIDIINQEYFTNKNDFKQYCLDIYNMYGGFNDDVVLVYKVNDNEIIYFSYLFFEMDVDGIIDESIYFDGYRLY